MKSLLLFSLALKIWNIHLVIKTWRNRLFENTQTPEEIYIVKRSHSSNEKAASRRYCWVLVVYLPTLVQ